MAEAFGDDAKRLNVKLQNADLVTSKQQLETKLDELKIMLEANEIQSSLITETERIATTEITDLRIKYRQLETHIIDIEKSSELKSKDIIILGLVPLCSTACK